MREQSAKHALPALAQRETRSLPFASFFTILCRCGADPVQIAMKCPLAGRTAVVFLDLFSASGQITEESSTHRQNLCRGRYCPAAFHQQRVPLHVDDTPPYETRLARLRTYTLVQEPTAGATRFPWRITTQIRRRSGSRLCRT